MSKVIILKNLREIHHENGHKIEVRNTYYENGENSLEGTYKDVGFVRGL